MGVSALKKIFFSLKKPQRGSFKNYIANRCQLFVGIQNKAEKKQKSRCQRMMKIGQYDSVENPKPVSSVLDDTK